MYRQLSVEIETQRKIARSRKLSAFHRNATTWELLLLLAANDGESDLGVYNTLDQLETGYLGQSALLKFLRDRRLDGLLSFDEHEKRSKWRLRLEPALYEEVVEYLAKRNRELAKLLGSDETAGPESDIKPDGPSAHVFAKTSDR
ncbi:MAG: hypothetical protein HLUCCA12_18075 [Rhodobacteraceae bacterium HLUCCA12]|nr:MAG: hypothetical protein HLUCCA12_18075 [Rhodobacteraceae bacterium HLUCCA12]